MAHALIIRLTIKTIAATEAKMNRFALFLRSKSLLRVASRRISRPAPSQRVFVIGVGMTKVSAVL